MTNPFDFGRNMLQAWEESMNQTLEKLTHDETFIKSMSKALSGSLDLKAQTESHLEKYLHSINMPTRSDLERMLQYLQRIEQKLLDLEDRLADNQPGAVPLGAYPAVPPGPPAATPKGKAPVARAKARPKPAKTAATSGKKRPVRHP